MNIPPFKLERFFDKYEFKVKYLLCSSDCETVTTGELLDLEPEARQRLEKLGLGYTEYTGNPSLRQAISGLYLQIAPDQVMVHTGAQEAIFNFMSSVLVPGDHLVVHSPCYQSLAQVALSTGCEVTFWKTRPENGWSLDLDFLRKSIRPNTKAIVVNCPHNPTGYLMDHSTQNAIIEIAREHNLLLFSDEVYRELEIDLADRLPAACDLYENAISLGVMSKTYGLAGLRIGWVATRNSSVLEKMAAFKDYLSMCNSAPSEFLAELALRHRFVLVERNLGIIRDNLALLDKFFDNHRDTFSHFRPKAGSVMFPAYKRELSVEQFCLDMVEKTGVLLLPGTLFDYDRHFRLGFARKNMPEALTVLEDYLIS